MTPVVSQVFFKPYFCVLKNVSVMLLFKLSRFYYLFAAGCIGFSVFSFTVYNISLPDKIPQHPLTGIFSQEQITWIDDSGTVSENAKVLLDVLQNSCLDGLNPEDYQFSGIRKNLKDLDQAKKDANTLKSRGLAATLNRLLDQAFILYAMHQFQGRFRNEVDHPYGQRRITAVFLKDSISKALLSGDVRRMLAAFECPLPLYKRYKNLLAIYLARRVQSYARVSPGKVTVMNTLDSQIMIIRINMERCRWYGRDPGSDTQMIINIPSFRLSLQVRGMHILEMKIIAGLSRHPTPMIRSEMKGIILHPYWNIPPGILARDILPATRKDSSYLSRHQIHKVHTGGKVRYRQDPGKGNPLGEIKLTFSNRHFISIHDTPDKELFKKNIRSFSNGCIRIEKARQLAAALLHVDSANFANMLDSVPPRQETWILYKGACDILVTYRTIEFDDSGNPVFLRDVYGRDRKMMKLLKWVTGL